MNTNLFWCIIGIVGGAITSFVISYLFYFKGLMKKRLTYDIKTFSIVSEKINQIEGMEIKYKSLEIDNLYSSTITVKNIGNSIIKEQDLAPLCPLSVSTSGFFLKAKSDCIVSQPVNKISQYALSFQGNEGTYNYVKLDFDYIPKKAIITYSLFHTGDIIFNGDLMDGEIVTPIKIQRQKKIKYFLSNFLTIIVSVILGALFSYFSI